MIDSINGINYAGTNAVAFGQAPATGQAFVTSPYPNDSFVSSQQKQQPAKKEKKGSLLKTVLIAAAVVLGGSAAAKKWLPAVRDFDKAVLSADKVKITDRIIGCVSGLGEKVLEIGSKITGKSKKATEEAAKAAEKDKGIATENLNMSEIKAEVAEELGATTAEWAESVGPQCL